MVTVAASSRLYAARILLIEGNIVLPVGSMVPTEPEDSPGEVYRVPEAVKYERD